MANNPRFFVLVCALMSFLSKVASAEEPTLMRSDWAPAKGRIAFLSRDSVEILLDWDKVIPGTPENSLEIEVILPEWKRSRVQSTNVFNRLKKTEVLDFPLGCQYKDIAFGDSCENWSQGILLDKNCLGDRPAGRLRIMMAADPIPQNIISSRLLVSRSEEGSLRQRALVAGGVVGCQMLCTACWTPVGFSCPDIFGKWLKNLCTQCDRAPSVPEWNYFSQRTAWCAEPAYIPGATEFMGCGKPPFGVTCEDFVRTEAPEKGCVPGAQRCSANGAVVEACAADGYSWHGITSCQCSCQNDRCVEPVCKSGASRCQGVSAIAVCQSNGCAEGLATCPCGCSSATQSCKPPICATSTCRDATTLIKCDGGCSTTTVSCGYGCKDGLCRESTGPVPDMSSPPDMSAPPPLVDLAGPSTAETCNGIDDDRDGIVDNPSVCWHSVYRFKDPVTLARCYGIFASPPPACSTYALERQLFSIPAYPWFDGSTEEYVQCSSGTDHVLVVKNSSEQLTLAASGYTCAYSLGYFFKSGRGPSAKTPFANTCPLYRQKYSTPYFTQSHWFSADAESVALGYCEGTAGEVVTNGVCGKPSGC